MVAGLPGTGIGGLFYVMASGWMMVRECYAKVRRRRDLSQWEVVRRQSLLTLSIVVGMWAAGEVVGRIMLLLPEGKAIFPRSLALHALSSGKYSMWRLSVFIWTVATLGLLYVVMHALRVSIRVSSPVSARRNLDEEVATASSGIWR